MTPEVRTALRRLDRQFDATRAMPTLIPPSARYRYSIEDVKQGGYLRTAGQTLQVVTISKYVEKGDSGWHELELYSLSNGDTVYLEWEKDDEIEISLNQPAISLREIGKTTEEIEKMSEEDEGSIQYGGRTYHYDDDYPATYVRGGTGQGEPVYTYDFETPDERWCLSVEEWGDEKAGYEYEVYVSEYLEADAIEVLALGAGADAS